MSVRPTNLLAREKSPYLLQHAHNPVDWHAWNETAFARARAENKPIFLSIGYSTCHWCHVMERETFENEAVGNYLRDHYISIKVDREERPDVDKIYMTFVQSTTGSGGWPLTVFLTPDLKPFFGGTYFPPETRHGRPGFLQILEQINEVWQTRQVEVLDSAGEMTARLELATQTVPGSGLLNAELLRHAGLGFKRMFDPDNGGFGDAPKFPQPSIPSALLRYGRRFQDEEAWRMVLTTCDHMAAGGINDQLGGGFSRYSVDAEWLVPHFEKMLYDNAQLAQLYLDAHLISPKDGQYAAVARDILDYILRDMTHPDGGFYSAEDADSEGHEGKFYCWTRTEVSALLTPEEFKVAARYFGLTDQGNFTDHSHPTPLPNQNVLSVVDPILSPSERETLASAKQKMLLARAKRIRPHLDDKILASWNGLMLGAFARAYAVLGDKKYRLAAERNVAFIQAKLWQPPGSTGTGILFHRWRDGEHDQVQLLEAYAFQLSGVVELYEATLEPTHLEFAIALAESLLEGFFDPEHGGFWQSGAATGDLILRVKDDYDGAEPSGNSVATLALLKLAAITGRDKFRFPANATLNHFTIRLTKVPQAVPFLLHSLDFWLDEPRRVVIAGDPQSPAARVLIHAAHSFYQPNKVALGNRGPVEPFAQTLPATTGPVAYLCTGTECQPPTTDPVVLAAGLG